MADEPATPSEVEQPEERKSHAGLIVAGGLAAAAGVGGLAYWATHRGGTTSAPSTCPPGQYLPAGASECTQCPAGQVRSQGMPIAQCVACSEGQNPLSDQSGCASPPAVTVQAVPNALLVGKPSGSEYATDEQGKLYPIADAAAITNCNWCATPIPVGDQTIQALIAQFGEGAAVTDSGPCPPGGRLSLIHI